MDLLSSLENCDELERLSYRNLLCYKHRHHRWVLCLIHWAQEQKILPKPCTLVMFDAHHDLLDPYHRDDVQRIRKEKINIPGLIDLCEHHLSQGNDDWIIAGMEIGLISNAVILGVHDRNHGQFPDDRYSDKIGRAHIIKVIGRPMHELAYQGDLSDTARSESLSELWELLSWEMDDNYRFHFASRAEKILLDFDLDFFAMRWGDYILPWPDEVFCGEFHKESDYGPTCGWSGKRFVQELAGAAGMMTIATEPGCCGGERNVRSILERFNRHILDNALGP